MICNRTNNREFYFAGINTYVDPFSALFPNKVKKSLKVAYTVNNKNRIISVADIIDPDTIYFYAFLNIFDCPLRNMLWVEIK